MIDIAGGIILAVLFFISLPIIIGFIGVISIVLFWILRMAIIFAIVFGVLFYFINLSSTTGYGLIGSIGALIWFFAVSTVGIKWCHKLPKLPEGFE